MTAIPTKETVRSVATSNITLSGTQTVNGVALVAGDRCLVAGQTTGANNGIYRVLAGAWTRTYDATSSGVMFPGHTVYVSEGTYANSIWACTNTGVIVLGTTALTYARVHPKVFRTVHTFAIQGSVAVATVPPFFVSVSASPSAQAINMVKARYVIQSGTNVTFKIQKNGADWTGYGTTGSPLTATSTAAETVQSNALADNDYITLVIVALSASPANLTVTCVLEHTV